MISSQEWKTKSWAKWKLEKCVDCEYNDHNDSSTEIYNNMVPKCTKLNKSIFKCTRKDCRAQAQEPQKLRKSQVEVTVEEPPQELPTPESQGPIAHWFENRRRRTLTLENHISKMKEQKEKASEDQTIIKTQKETSIFDEYEKIINELDAKTEKTNTKSEHKKHEANSRECPLCGKPSPKSDLKTIIAYECKDCGILHASDESYENLAKLTENMKEIFNNNPTPEGYRYRGGL